MEKQIVLTLLGDAGTGRNSHMSKITYPVGDVADEAALLTRISAWKTELAKYTDASLSRTSIISFDMQPVTAPGKAVNMDVQAVIYAVDTDKSERHTFTIPGLKATGGLTTELTANGERIAKTSLDSLQTALRALTGIQNLSLVWGKIIQKS